MAQSNYEENNLPSVATVVGTTLEGQTTASAGRSCAQCGCPLTGRKERFCSDACRMRRGRRDRGND